MPRPSHTPPRPEPDPDPGSDPGPGPGPNAGSDSGAALQAQLLQHVLGAVAGIDTDASAALNKLRALKLASELLQAVADRTPDEERESDGMAAAIGELLSGMSEGGAPGSEGSFSDVEAGTDANAETGLDRGPAPSCAYL